MENDKHKIPIIAGVGLAWLIATFFVIRIAIPYLVNQHNDGALIFSLVIGFGWLYASYLVYRTMEDFYHAE